MLFVFGEELKCIDMFDSDALSFRFVKAVLSSLDHHALFVQRKA